MNNLVATYVPREAKARALGMCFSGFHAGGLGLGLCPAGRLQKPHQWHPRTCCHSLTRYLPAGNLAGLILSPILLIQLGWRALFYIFGFLGGPLLAMWWAVVPDKASTPPAAGAAPVTGSMASTTASAGSQMTPWKLMSKAATWAIIIVNIVNHWGYFIYLNWMPTYFVKVRAA
jgi:ACS family sodium-dependent inorganic phosphate cotransporter/ACS family sodium-dependent inorganic phosphate cotransporter-like MFS transporter 9